MTNLPPDKNRWYDQQPTVSRAVDILNDFPLDFQIVLANSIVEIAESHCNVNELLADLRTLGPEKVLSVFKSKSKRRELDASKEVHHALNCMYILSDGDRIFIANHLITLGSYLVDYFKICKTEGMQPSLSIAREVSAAYIKGDLHDPAIFLTIIRAQIQLSTHYSFQLTHLGNVNEPLPAISELTDTIPVEYDEKVDTNKQGMRIRRDKLP